MIERRKFDTPDSEIEYTEATFMERPHEAVTAIVKGVEDVLADREFTLDSSLGAVKKSAEEKLKSGRLLL